MLYQVFKTFQPRISFANLVPFQERDKPFSCFISHGKQLEICTEKVEEMPVCDENSPDFDPSVCTREFMTCLKLFMVGVKNDCMKAQFLK